MTTILSWNVNGLRAVQKNGFLDWLSTAKPDILCLQESRVLPTDLKEDMLQPEGYTSYFNPAQKKGYSGTAAYVRDGIKLLSAKNSGLEAFDAEGRIQILEFEEFTILNGYWPNSQPERARLDYKLEYCKAITALANKLVKKGKNVVLCGDMNIAHQAIDLARPKDNENTAGYYIEEREAMTQILKKGYVDTFRQFNSEPGQYSWWSYRANARQKNVGWRIDYHLVNEAFLPRVKEAFILQDVTGSDHCPVGIRVD